MRVKPTPFAAPLASLPSAQLPFNRFFTPHALTYNTPPRPHLYRIPFFSISIIPTTHDNRDCRTYPHILRNTPSRPPHLPSYAQNPTVTTTRCPEQQVISYCRNNGATLPPPPGWSSLYWCVVTMSAIFLIYAHVYSLGPLRGLRTQPKVETEEKVRLIARKSDLGF